MTEKLFINFASHFVSHARCSPERPCLLLLDNHDSHLFTQVLDYFKDNGVTLLSFPPHCSHKLQPLDRSVYGPLKKYINSACDAWICTNKRPMKIYDIPSIMARATPLALTPNNIMSGFRVSGIVPLNPDIFTDADFMPAYFTDRPAPVQAELDRPTISLNEERESSVTINNEPEVQGLLQEEPCFEPQEQSIHCPTPEEVRPLEKAGPRKESSRGRKKRKSAILTDSPVKEQLRSEQLNSKKRKETKNDHEKHKKKVKKNLFGKKSY